MIYPKFKTFQVLIPLLKAHNISNIVISPGSRMREFVIAVEEDPYFTTYDVTDERSASYFAMGISQELNAPVVIVCTSSTATTNYVPGVTEAFYQNVPLIVLTGDRDPYMLGQQEDQMINQVGMYDRVVRHSVSLPIVKNDFDKWCAERLINEALLELDHHNKGPVHINVPVPAIVYWNNDKEITGYPKVKVIKRYAEKDLIGEIHNLIEILCRKKKILILAGQSSLQYDSDQLQKFFQKFNCVIHSEYMGNLCGQGVLNIAAISEGIREEFWEDYLPDLIISFHGTFAISRNLKETLRLNNCEHWLIDEEGKIVDAYRNLTTIFECKPDDLFKAFIDNAPAGISNDLNYYNIWESALKKVHLPDFRFSNVYAINRFLQVMPQNSILHLSILNSIRITHHFNLPLNTKVYANIGTDGIDGCMSTFFGQASVSSKECFLIIGDLSFFYDMNSLRIKHNKANCHILLINNHGGNEFFQQPLVPTTPQGLGASHENSARGWAESVGFKYLKAENCEEFDRNVKQFASHPQLTPILFEVFTDQIIDRESVFELRKAFSRVTDKYSGIREKVRDVVGQETISTVKKIFGK